MKEFKGDLKGFPSEVVEKMLERQVEQGSKRDVKIFEVSSDADKRVGALIGMKLRKDMIFGSILSTIRTSPLSLTDTLK